MTETERQMMYNQLCIMEALGIVIEELTSRKVNSSALHSSKYHLDRCSTFTREFVSGKRSSAELWNNPT